MITNRVIKNVVTIKTSKQTTAPTVILLNWLLLIVVGSPSGSGIALPRGVRVIFPLLACRLSRIIVSGLIVLRHIVLCLITDVAPAVVSSPLVVIVASIVEAVAICINRLLFLQSLYDRFVSFCCSW